MTLVHMNIIKGTTRTVYTDSLMGSSKAMFIKMPLLVNIGAKVHNNYMEGSGSATIK